MVFAAMLVSTATAFNAGAALPLAGATRPAAISRAGSVIAHDNAPLEQATEIMDARLDPQVAQGRRLQIASRLDLLRPLRALLVHLLAKHSRAQHSGCADSKSK